LSSSTLNSLSNLKSKFEFKVLNLPFILYMTANEKTLVKFYSLANADASKMSECYHTDITFRDPHFGLLKGPKVSQMWKMLIDSNEAGLKLTLQHKSR
jgi:hypothetical protein